MARDVGPARKVAVVLFNLGGPDRLESVRPFLFNLFSDPAIITVPAMLRLPLALLISRLRDKAARANYALIGGASPLLEETQAQAGALQAVLSSQTPAWTSRVFIAMRHWRPFSEETARAVEAFGPDEIVLVPLYPQFSTTTTASSLAAWKKAYKGQAPTRVVCCYPTQAGLIQAHAARVQEAWEGAGRPEGMRLLFSAHGLPLKVIEAGDPYQAQIEATAAAIAERLGGVWDWQVCYQSRVGPMKWLGPSTPEAIRQAAEEGLGVIVTPIAFVSEHIETLVELDRDYAELAHDVGCPIYVRAPALGTHESFIEGLSDLVIGALDHPACAVGGDDFACEGHWSGCPRRAVGANR